MTDSNALTALYRENLEESIVKEVAALKGFPLREAMALYYTSKLAKQIELGLYGIDNLSLLVTLERQMQQAHCA